MLSDKLRDMFIPEDQKPDRKPVDETTISFIFNFMDEALEVFGFCCCLITRKINIIFFKIMIIANSGNDRESIFTL